MQVEYNQVETFARIRPYAVSSVGLFDVGRVGWLGARPSTSQTVADAAEEAFARHQAGIDGWEEVIDAYRRMGR